MYESITKLCKEYTDLNEDEISVLHIMSSTLQALANLEAADIFIDCPCSGEDAIVVAEAKPEDAPSAYKSSVVGMYAKAENEPAVMRTLKMGISTKHMKARTQEGNFTIQSVEPIKFNEKVIGVLIREKRMNEEDEEKQAYKSVPVALGRILSADNWLAESIDEGLLLIDERGRVSFSNAYAKNLYKTLGFMEELLGTPYKNLSFITYDESYVASAEECLKEVTYGKYCLSIRHIYMQEGEVRMAVILRDITMEREKEKSLVLKSVAIKELHHRVKNNLQTIASLLRLQARRTDNTETQRILYETINRILSISVTHQLLEKNEMDQISLKEVLTSVRYNAMQQFVRPGFRGSIELLGDDITVDSDIASSVALSVNELLQNSIKYAFENKNEGRITVTIETGNVYSTVTVTDDGIGFDPKNGKRESLGLNIVESMVRDKLHGSLKIWSNGSGTKVMFDFMNETADVISIL